MAVDELLLARLRAVLVTGLIGAVTSHVWVPWAPGTSRGRRAAFAALMFALGAAFGAVDANLRHVAGARRGMQAAMFGSLAVALAVAAYVLLHD